MAKSQLFIMKSLVCKVLLVNLALIALNSCTNAQQIKAGNNLSSNNKSFGKGAEIDKMVVKNFQNLTRIEDLLDLFSIEEIGAQWTRLYDKLSPACSMDMLQYLAGLEQRKLWAMKMDDASGHYTTGFFWGNNYWTGSMPLCRHIIISDEDLEFMKKDVQNVGLSFLNNGNAGNTGGGSLVMYENPPFIPRFFVLKVEVNESMSMPEPRTVYIGLCLPSTCGEKDMVIMSDFGKKPIERRSIDLLSVRIPGADGFSFWTDKTFIIMLFVTILVTIFIIWGTAYDSILRKRMKNKMALKKYSKDLNSDSSGLNCTTYDLTRAITQDKNDKNNCVGIGIPSGLNNNNSDENLAIESNMVEEEKLTIYEELLLSFSVVTNFKAICDRAVGSDTIPSIHGLRAISMAWVVLGHTCIVAFKYSDNMELRKVVEKEFLFQTISNGAFSVDTFFFISGFLVSFIYFRTNAKGKLDKLSKNVSEFTSGSFHFFGLVAYRFVRLTAPYLYVLGIVELTMKYFASNSVFEPPTQDHINCPKYWWRNMLYINTLFPVDDMCMLWSWYLANDTQFYIIGAIILIIAIRHFKFAAAIMAIFMVSAWITTGIIAYTHNHMPNSDDPLALFDKIYDKPWTRLGPYLIGMSVGWILFKTNCKINFSKLQLVIGWVSSSGMLLFLLYGLYRQELSKVFAAAYSSLSHSLWALSLAWIIIACSTGNGGTVNKILSAPCLYPFSRVTYCAYLVHPIVIRIVALNSDAPIHMGVDSMVIIFLGQVAASYILSFIISLAFEAPIVKSLKVLRRF